MPAQGCHQVNIGSSFSRALKARKAKDAEPPGPSKRLPERDFYAFRYNFKPSSIDSEKPGSIDVRKATDSTLVTVEYPSKQAGENHVFKGVEKPAKEWDCVLIYDEELGTFTLEKLDSHLSLTYERKTATSRQPPASSNAPPPRAQARAAAVDDLEAQLERDLLDLANPDPEEVKIKGAVSKTIARRQEEEEEEEKPLAKVVAPRRQLPAQRPKSPPKQKPAQRPTKPQPKLKAKAQPVPPPGPAQASAPRPLPVQASKPPPPVVLAVTAKPPTQPPLKPKPIPAQSKSTKKREFEHPQAQLSDGDEEVLEMGQPAKKKNRKLSPPRSPPSSGLALPGTSSSVAPPPPMPSAPPISVTTSASSVSSSSKRPIAASTSSYPGNTTNQVPPPEGESESEGEWSEVEPEAVQGDDYFGDNLIEDGDEPGQEIDMDEFEEQMKLQMEEVDDEDSTFGGMNSPEPDDEIPRGQPISLNDYARGITGFSDDDTSSSDDSDDD
ncbi:hypothetical protein AMATHDRAFT_70688 [Amanita thiersii Skay4041]|uniref:Transcription elongation factor Eaf N-terminal domain-containing protein n=1 Tax=Amanita thiersii Skay4041 TaxID=703135 RepID=A0A2A9NEB5_9AGAR|nr:hypothetical protein AMATHDRAFT_70688 [Amanita thiersii Skay4041]